MSEKAGIKVVDWGRGPLPIIWAMTIVGLLILSNSLGLILSQSYVIKGVPKEYRSSLEGEIQLPFIPIDESGVELMIPEEVPIGEPFDVGFTFPDGRIPHLCYEAVFVLEGEERIYRLFQMGNMIGTRIPMLNLTGHYEVHIRAREIVDAPVLHHENWIVNVTDKIIDHPVPILDGNLAPMGADSLIFKTFDLYLDEITQFWININEEKTTQLSEIEEDKWGIRTGDLFGSGWNLLVIGRGDPLLPDVVQKYFVYKGYDPFSDSWNFTGSVSTVLKGDDELFDQRERDSHQGLGGDDELELYIDALYRISLRIAFDKEFSLSILPNSSFHLRSGSRTYPVVKDLEGSFIGYFFPPETDEEGYIQIICDLGYEEFVIEQIDILLKIDHSPHSRWDPDPFALETLENGIPSEMELELLADWENFNRKDFVDEPNIDVNGQEKLPVNDEEEFLEHSYSYILTGSEVYSGNTINISSTNSLNYANWLVLLVPTPQIFLVFPFPLTGWIAVGWFVMISIACLASVLFLFYRQLKPLWKGKRRTSMTKRFKELYSPESELALTSKTYLGALFFFFAIFWMLNIFEQPTPGLSILSSETPIWIRMFLLADASVWEEISGRVVLIGIPLLIIRSFSDKRGVQWKQLLGGTAKFRWAEVALILLSASLFGLAHLGWGPWKVIPTFVHGLLFGYLFVKVGLHATIVMHFLFDYTGFVNEITGIYGPIWMFIFFTTLLLGGLFLGDWFYRCQEWSSNHIFGRVSRPAYQLVAHSVISIVLGALLVYKNGPLSISVLFFSIPLIDSIFYFLWKKNRSWVLRFIVFIWAHFAWAAAPFGIAWSVKPEEDTFDQGS